MLCSETPENPSRSGHNDDRRWFFLRDKAPSALPRFATELVGSIQVGALGDARGLLDRCPGDLGCGAGRRDVEILGERPDPQPLAQWANSVGISSLVIAWLWSLQLFHTTWCFSKFYYCFVIFLIGLLAKYIANSCTHLYRPVTPFALCWQEVFLVDLLSVIALAKQQNMAGTGDLCRSFLFCPSGTGSGPWHEKTATLSSSTEHSFSHLWTSILGSDVVWLGLSAYGCSRFLQHSESSFMVRHCSKHRRLLWGGYYGYGNFISEDIVASLSQSPASLEEATLQPMHEWTGDWIWEYLAKVKMLRICSQFVQWSWLFAHVFYFRRVPDGLRSRLVQKHTVAK